MEYSNNIAKVTFYLMMAAGCYFLLAFTGVLQQAESKVIGALFELLTIPSIGLVVAVFLFSLYGLITKRCKVTLYSLASLLVSLVLILGIVFMFLK
jgi:hypothetical protein